MEDPEPDLDDFGDEPNAPDPYMDGEDDDPSHDDERRSRPARRAPLVEIVRTRPASEVLKEAWAEVSKLDPELFERWTMRPGRRGHQPSARMTGVPEGGFRTAVLRRVFKGELHNVSDVVELKSLTKDQPELDFTHLNHGDAQTVRKLIVDNGKNFRKALRWAELLGDCYKVILPNCPDLVSKQRQRWQFLHVVWPELAVLPDPTCLSATSKDVTDRLEAIVASLNDMVRLAEVRQLLSDQSVRRRVLAALDEWTPVPEDIGATSTDALCAWVDGVISASEDQASASMGALINGLPNNVSQNELDAQLVILARDSLVHTEKTSALQRKPSIDSRAHASQDYLSAAPLNQALYQRLEPIFHSGSPEGVDHDSLPSQLEAEGRRCATWVGVDSDLARLTLVLGFRVIGGIETLLSSRSVARTMPKDSLCRRVVNSARRFAALKVEFSSSYAITSGKSTIYRQIINVMEAEYMRRLWRALHRREFTGVGGTLDLPTITAILTDTMLTITSWVHETYKAERRGALPVRRGALPVAHPAQPLVSYLSGYLHEAPPAPDPSAVEAARAIETYLSARPPAFRERRVSARTRPKEMNHADLASLAITTVATIRSCCDASADLKELRGQATDDDILDLILGM